MGWRPRSFGAAGPASQRIAARGQLVARAAWMMTLATTPGSVIMDRWGALISVMLAPAFWAMASCSAGGSTLSAVPTIFPERVVFPACGADRLVDVLYGSRRSATANTAPPAG